VYETFEHTADVGLRVRAVTLEELFADAARGLFALLVPRASEAEPREAVSLAVVGDATDELLRDWLAELLYTFNVRRLVFSQFDVALGVHGLTATVRGEPFDPERHEGGVEVKAITWHGLRLEQTADGWLGEVIVDI
jgi:SHS2 domain-containing protein